MSRFFMVQCVDATYEAHYPSFWLTSWCSVKTSECIIIQVKISELSFYYSTPQCSHCKRCTSYSNSVCLSVSLSDCLSVRLSVRLSHAGIVSKRRHVAR